MKNSNKLFVAVDVETTGLEAGSRMIELGAILFDGYDTLDKFEQLVDPGMPLPEDAAKVNGITDDMLAGQPDAGTVLRDFLKWLDPCNQIIAHYARYDTGIISWEAGRFGVDIPEELTVTDTRDIAKAIGETKDNKLITLADHYGLENIGKDHRALNDAHLCGEYFKMMNRNREYIGGSPPEYIGGSLPWAMTGHDYSYTDEFPEQLSVLPELVEKAEPLNFVYKDAKGNVTTRIITPYGFALTSSGLMFHGRCHVRKARRTFRADRLVEVIHEGTIKFSPLGP